MDITYATKTVTNTSMYVRNVLISIQYALDLFDCLKADYEHKSATGLYINGSV